MAGHPLLGNHSLYHAGQHLRHTATEPETILRLFLHLSSRVHHAGGDQRDSHGYDRASVLRAGVHAVELGRLRGYRCRGTSLRQDHD